MIRTAQIWPVVLAVLAILGCADYENYEGDAPDSVELSTVAASDTSVALRWTRAETEDFRKYEIWYHTAGNVDTFDLFGDSLIFQQDTFTIIGGLEPSTRYYFRAFVRTNRGAISISNVVDTITLKDLHSLRITIQDPDTTRITHNSVVLEWQSTWLDDRRPFGIFADTTEYVDSVRDTSVTNGFIRVKDRYSKEITGLAPDTDYWFRVFVLDSTSPTVGSEPVKVTTRSDIPTPPVLTIDNESIGISSVSVHWSAAEEMLFESYAVYCDTVIPDTSTPCTDTSRIYNTLSDTSHTLVGLKPGTRYYTALWVWAVTDTFAVSSIDSFVTDSGIPTPSDLTVHPDSMSDGRVVLVWDANEDPFFQEYRVYFDSTAFDTTVLGDTSIPYVRILGRDSTSFARDGITGTRAWWAMVATVSKTGRIGAGEVVKFFSDEAMPDPVILKTVPEELTETSARLTWSSSESSILKRYILFSSNSRDIDMDAAEYEDVGTGTSHGVSFPADSIVWYAVAVEDSLGNRTLSNAVPSLGAVLKIEEEENQWHVFLSKWPDDMKGYGLYRSNNTIDEPLPRMQRGYAEDGRALNAFETPLSSGTYYYRVFVFLEDGTYWPSNQIVKTWQ